MGQQCRPNIRTRAFSAGSDGQWVSGPGSANLRSPQINGLEIKDRESKRLSGRPTSRLAALHSDYLQADKPLASSFQLFLDSDRNHVVICSLTVSHQPGHPPLPSRFCVCPRSLSAFDCQLLTSSSSTFQCAGRLPRLPRLPRLCRGTSRAPGPGVGACPACLSRLGRGLDFVGEFLGALDCSSLGLTLNLQSGLRRLSGPEIPTRSGFSTFNRVSFPSSHLGFSQRSAKSFTIRTSETPLPQLLYNPHLQAPLGSAGNKGLITPLESALTKISPVTPVESALTKKWGWV